MTHIASLKFLGGGREKLLEILYNVMQQPVGHDQRAYRAQQTLKTGVQDSVF